MPAPVGAEITGAAGAVPTKKFKIELHGLVPPALCAAAPQPYMWPEMRGVVKTHTP
jgi:hypothetical protein